MVYVVTALFIVLDFVTGLLKAFKEKSYTSTIMREGLYHKIGSVIIIVFATLVEYTCQYLDLGINIPILIPICSYIVIMEIGSIIENVCVLNPDIMPSKIKVYFGKLSDKEKE